MAGQPTPTTTVPVTLQIGLFFDGTRNNADNLLHASRPPAAPPPHRAHPPPPSWPTTPRPTRAA